ncbi:MAG: twin-arginine translocation signal domain-containing protein [Prolixibacteraceae bacterium]|nr:twin-arginine translocation signal domain-containing protein [Prolixibacteraceae bacterium]
MTTRRNFIRLTAMGSAALAGGAYINVFASLSSNDELSLLSNELLQTWINALLPLQITDQSKTEDYGGIWCPACKRVHGRVADAIYPLLYMADKKQDSKYLDSAILLYRWIEKHVSQPDGSWLNDPEKNSWKGITVFTSIALAETLINHGSLLEENFKNEVRVRLKKSGDYINNNFSMTYGNINYPINASYCLSLLGNLLDVKEFREKGRYFAHEALGFLSKNDRFIHGEGRPFIQPSAKGCYSVDLGYNVEESLPALVLYGKLTNDQEVLEAIVPSLQTHMEFMLPDGAWDNSWGTRNFKWTYWGSRTTDGCQPAYALMADRDPRFYKVALKSTELLKATTHNGLLYGGPHYVAHDVLPCVHHTFCHVKALTTILDHGIHSPKVDVEKLILPREKIYGNRFFQDIQTLLISVGKYRATVTAYDREYTMKNGHASGGALSLLWHEKTGPLLSASMNEYQMQEAGNMQPDNDPLSMPLTPRIELLKDGKFMNISDLKATMENKELGNYTIVTSNSRLVDQDQNSPASGEIKCQTVYTFQPNKVILEFSADSVLQGDSVRIVLPVISNSSEKFEMISKRLMQIQKENSLVKITSDSNLVILPTTGTRIFNFVPGLEAIPMAINQSKCRIEIEVV